uniref:Uncharacterized protein n=1 Tax=Arundo donax TaxID=35708 RepID=A0A0A9F922_ARUDO
MTATNIGRPFLLKSCTVPGIQQDNIVLFTLRKHYKLIKDKHWGVVPLMGVMSIEVAGIRDLQTTAHNKGGHYVLDPSTLIRVAL